MKRILVLAALASTTALLAVRDAHGWCYFGNGINWNIGVGCGGGPFERGLFHKQPQVVVVNQPIMVVGDGGGFPGGESFAPPMVDQGGSFPYGQPVVDQGGSNPYAAPAGALSNLLPTGLFGPQQPPLEYGYHDVQVPYGTVPSTPNSAPYYWGR
jgi:hypothetical protein